MRALLIFGMKFGKDNQALLDLGEKILDLGVEVQFKHWDDQWKESGSFEIVVGHSFGGFQAFWIGQTRPVKYLCLIDAVDPKWFPLGFSHYWKKFEIPSNVERAECFARSWNLLPPSGSIQNADGIRFRNYTGIKASHETMPMAKEVVDRIIWSVKSLGL